jgi:hypothetical protein
MSDERLARIEEHLHLLVTGQAKFATSLEELRNHMGVLHEDVVARIQALGEDDSLEIAMERRFDEVLRSLADHAIPGDATDRYLARKIKEHDERLDALGRAGGADKT